MQNEEYLPVVKENNFKTNIKQAQEVIHYVIDAAQKHGADQVEASIGLDCGFVVSVLNRDIEKIEFHNAQSLNLTVYFGKQKADVVINDFHLPIVKNVVHSACQMAKVIDSDPCVGLADRELMFTGAIPDLELYRPSFLNISDAKRQVLLCEATALDYHRYITRSEGASFSEIMQYTLYTNSYGFLQGRYASSYSLSCGVLSDDKGEMQRDSFYTVAHDYKDLLSAKEVGEEAALKTIMRHDARKIPTTSAPVLFLPEEARRLLSSFIAAISGGNIYRHASFLIDHLNKPVFPKFINIYEDPFIKKGWGSRVFDAEGVATSKRSLVEDGILLSYVLNSYTARKLGMQTTGNAGGVHNLYFKGTVDYSYLKLLKLMSRGLVVTETLGHGANIVTGDYSQGVVGFWVENGTIKHAVQEVTIAGNLKEMFINLQAIGNDYDFRGNIITGSLLFSELTIAGL